MRVVTEPLLDLSDVGLVIKRVGGGGRAQRMRADQKPQLARIGPHQTIAVRKEDRAGTNRLWPTSFLSLLTPSPCAGDRVCVLPGPPARPRPPCSWPWLCAWGRGSARL